MKSRNERVAIRESRTYKQDEEERGNFFPLFHGVKEAIFLVFFLVFFAGF